MRCPPRFLGSTAFILSTIAVLTALCWAPSARAQYMYLDSNGDGLHTAADALGSSGTTTVDVWLATDRNRDGTPATCADGSSYQIFTYEFCLTASNGHVAYSNFVNRMEAIPLATFAGGNATQ